MPSLYASQGNRGYALASGKLPKGGSSGGLSPVLLSGGGGGGAAPRLNIHAGDVRFTPMPIPQNVINTNMQALAAFSQTAVNSAFDYQNREADVYANFATAEYESAISESYYGGVRNGKPFKGYSHTEGMDSAESFQAYQEGLIAKRDEILENLNPLARQKSSLRMQNVYNLAMRQASGHRVKQLEVAYQDSLVVEGQNILSGYEKDLHGSWNRSVEHANKFTPEQKITVLSNHMNHALSLVDNQALSAGGPFKEDNAFAAKMQFFESHKGDIDAKSRIAIKAVLLEEFEALEATKQDRQSEAIAVNQEQGAFFGPQQMTNILRGGPAGMINPDSGITAHVEKVLQDYPNDINGAMKQLSTDYEKAFSNVTTNQGYAIAVKKFEKLDDMAQRGVITAGTEEVFTELKKYVYGDMKKLDDTLTRDERNAQKGYILSQIRNAKTTEEVNKINLPSSILGEPGMLTFFENAKISQNKSIDATWEKQNSSDQKHNYLLLRQMAKGGKTLEFEEFLTNEVDGKRLTIGQHDKLIAEAKDYDKGKIDPNRAEVEKNLSKTVTNDNYGMLPDGTVKPWRVMTKNEIEETKDFYERTKRIPAEREMIMQSLLMEQSDAWLSNNPNKTINDWHMEVMMQSPEEKQNRFLKSIVSSMRKFGNKHIDIFEEPSEVPGPYQYQTKLPDQPQAIYQPKTIGGVEGFSGVTSFAPETYSFRTWNDYTKFTVKALPQNVQRDYAEFNSDQLAAVQMLREQNPNIDKMRVEEVANLANRLQTKKEFVVWKQQRQNKLKAF